jgi:hypothetical protein
MKKLRIIAAAAAAAALAAMLLAAQPAAAAEFHDTSQTRSATTITNGTNWD